MSVVKRVQSRTKQAVGEAKHLVGKATGNRKLSTSGKADRVVGSLRETGNEVRDWARVAAKDARRRIANHRHVS
ncbi:CsbD family protein [Amycolatopsis pigmentata]|uniref:CsbD family protein n=1 Tax=Amycolatopsis pigmentata TaxID=450801 RepID=A0ABW5FU44_9PSEU